MLKRITFLFLITLISSAIFASGIKGIISDQNGKSLPYATIFIPENGTGTVTNGEGYYEVNLAPGEYLVTFQYLGFTAVQKKIVVTRGQKVTENVILIEQTLELKTIEVTEGRENPAYTIMRKAIAKAEFHRQQIESYTAQVYIKGSGRLLKSPLLLRKAIEKEGVDSTTAFLVESVSEVSYQRPNTYEEKVISIRQQGDNNAMSPNGYINSSFYDPEVVTAVSPLAPRAFAYYKFEFLGSFFERGHEVNKIKVTPRSRGEGVYEGTISIVDDLWGIHSLKLKTYKLGVGIEISQVYAPILESAWMPVTHKFFVDAKLFGFNFVYDYLATVSDYKVEINPDLDVSFTVIDEKLNKELAAEIEKRPTTKKGTIEEKLASGEELTRKDLRKLMKEYEKEDRKEQEEPDLVENRMMEIDSNAQNRDTAFWANIRPVPLTKYEVKSYKEADSLAIVKKLKVEAKESNTETKGSGSNSKKSSSFNIGNIVFGEWYKLGEKTHFVYDGLLEHIAFNAAEEIALSSKFGINHKLENNQKLFWGIQPRYSFGRKKIIAKGFLEYDFGEKFRKGSFHLEGGKYVSQFNEEGAISTLVNNIYYVFGENYVNLFEKQFIKGSYRKRLKDGLNIHFSGEYAQRNTIENTAENGWFFRDDNKFLPNTPNNIEIGNQPFESHKAVVLNAGFEWKPWIRYKINNGEKSFVNKAPIFSLDYKKGLADVDYDFVETGIKYTWTHYGGSRTDFKVLGGAFLNKDSLTLPDFRHFPGNQTILTTADPVESFRLLDYYNFSTKDKFAQVHVHHQFRKFLLTQMPMVWMTGLKENAFVNYLATPNSQNYMEVGYGLDNIFKIFRLEVITSFQDFEYHDLGFRISISSMIGVGTSSGDDGKKSFSINL